MRSNLRAMLPIAAIFVLATVGLTARLEAATLKVSSFPSGAQVLVDGVNTGKVTPMSIALSEGDHSVTAQIPGSGWSADTRTVTIVSCSGLPFSSHACVIDSSLCGTISS